MRGRCGVDALVREPLPPCQGLSRPVKGSAKLRFTCRDAANSPPRPPRDPLCSLLCCPHSAGGGAEARVRRRQAVPQGARRRRAAGCDTS